MMDGQFALGMMNRPLGMMNGSLARKLIGLAAAGVIGTILAGCIADTAEDTDLPWSSNKSWEGIAPISPAVMDRYE